MAEGRMMPEMAMVRTTGPDHHFLLANVWIGARARFCFVISARVLLGGGRGVAAVSADGAGIAAPAMSTGCGTFKGGAFWVGTGRERHGRAEREQR
jgi:hypothetical protein